AGDFTDGLLGVLQGIDVLLRLRQLALDVLKLLVLFGLDGRQRILRILQVSLVFLLVLAGHRRLRIGQEDGDVVVKVRLVVLDADHGRRRHHHAQQHAAEPAPAVLGPGPSAAAARTGADQFAFLFLLRGGGSALLPGPRRHGRRFLFLEGNLFFEIGHGRLLLAPTLDGRRGLFVLERNLFLGFGVRFFLEADLFLFLDCSRFPLALGWRRGLFVLERNLFLGFGDRFFL